MRVKSENGYIKMVLVGAALFALPLLSRAQTSHAPTTPSPYEYVRITSEWNLTKVVEQLEQPAVRLAALSNLIEFAEPELYRSNNFGGTAFSRSTQQLQKKAIAPIIKAADFDTISQAMTSTDPRLQFWGLRFWRGKDFKPKDKKPSIWLSLIPKVMDLAVNGDANIRFAAVEGLLGQEGTKDFLVKREESETSPDILLRILYSENGAALSERFNPVLMRLLNHQDFKVRKDALIFIGFNHNSAEMWQIAFDQAVRGKVLELTKSESETEKSSALYAMEGLQKSKSK